MKFLFYLKLLLFYLFFAISCKPEYLRDPRLVKTINSDWTFNYFSSGEADLDIAMPDFDDSEWKAVALPHTWSTYETTREIHPFIYNASERDDPYWWYGWGYYRKKFRIDKSLKNKKVFIEFDGVQKYAKVFLNGVYIGDHKGGFTSFYFDLTPQIVWGSDNFLVVMVSNRRNDVHRIPPMNAGNWNVYGGIYRDVRLLIKNQIHIPFQGSYKHEGGTFITTPVVTHESADVRVRTWIKNDLGSPQLVELETSIIDPSGEEILKKTDCKTIASEIPEEFNQYFKNLINPELWSPDNPVLYKVVSKVLVNGRLVDEYSSPLGFRYFHWDYENDDLYLNGKKINILGTNRHQEYPWLGDAHPKWIARMDMNDIKYNLGHNFMRLTHYPNDKYLYQLADSFGIIMVEEVPNIKSIDFSEEVQEQNVREMIRRDRNHPSIFFWSMGNETTDAADSKWAIEEDTTRIIHLRKGEQGGDYIDHTHENLDMENLLRVTIRGWFDQDDAPPGINSTPENGQHSSNETWQHEMARIGDGSVRGLLGDNCMSWLYEDHGADREYLNCILKHINPKGWVDMYRQPKYLYWLTKANYTDIPVVFIHPHFWREKYLGQEKNIQVDSNCEELELYVNGKSAGIKYPQRDSFNTVTFKNILVEKGSINAVGRKDGKEYYHIIGMPGPAAKIIAYSRQKVIKADRSGIAIIFVDILDKDGNQVFDASNTLEWTVSGPADLVGPGIYESDIMKHEQMEGTGYTVVPVANLIRSTNIPGKIKITISSEGLESAELIITSVKPDDKVSWLKERSLSDKGRSSVKRINEYKPDFNEIPLTILPLRENYALNGKTVKELIPELRSFIAERNFGDYRKYKAFNYLLEALALRLESMNGYLIADDFNFYIDQFNALVVIEDFISKANIPGSEKKTLAEYYADDVLIKGNQIDILEEIKKLKNN